MLQQDQGIQWQGNAEWHINHLGHPVTSVDDAEDVAAKLGLGKLSEIVVPSQGACASHHFVSAAWACKASWVSKQQIGMQSASGCPHTEHGVTLMISGNSGISIAIGFICSDHACGKAINAI